MYFIWALQKRPFHKWCLWFGGWSFWVWGFLGFRNRNFRSVTEASIPTHRHPNQSSQSDI